MRHYTHDNPDNLKEPGIDIAEYMKEQKREEDEKRKFDFYKESTIKLLQILETIANAIVNRPKTALALLIFVPVAINVLTSLIHFLSYQVWTTYIVPFLNGLGVAVK
jgi:hypothetical protein